jgi:hypothetical protein
MSRSWLEPQWAQVLVILQRYLTCEGRYTIIFPCHARLLLHFTEAGEAANVGCSRCNPLMATSFLFLLPEDMQGLQCGGMLVSGFDHVLCLYYTPQTSIYIPVPPFWPRFDIIDISLPFNGVT